MCHLRSCSEEMPLIFLSLVYMVEIGPTLLFSPKSVFPLTVVYVCSLNLLPFNLVNEY